MVVIAIVVLGLIVAIVGGIFAFLVGTLSAARKGYQSGTLAIVIAVGIGAGAGLFSALVATTSIDGGVLAVLAPLMFLGPPSAVFLLLPRRKPRRIFSVHRVTFPYALVGRAIFVTGCAASLVLSPLSWWYGGPVWLALFMLVLGPLFAFQLMVQITHVLGQPDRAVESFADILTSDPRPPVVFMRAFEREKSAFVSGPIAKYQRYSMTPRVHRKQLQVGIPLDQYLRGRITSRIGPLLALGNPQDDFTPAGAVRAYFKDETWMNEFQELAARACCLLVEGGASANLRWELQYLRQSKLHDRLVVVTEHPTRPNRSGFVQLAARVAGIEPASWDRFAATLTELGYEMPAGPPAPGSVIGFDADARAHVLATGADLPDEFVEPMAAWLAQRGHFGSANAM